MTSLPKCSTRSLARRFFKPEAAASLMPKQRLASRIVPPRARIVMTTRYRGWWLVRNSCQSILRAASSEGSAGAAWPPAQMISWRPSGASAPSGDGMRLVPSGSPSKHSWRTRPANCVPGATYRCSFLFVLMLVKGDRSPATMAGPHGRLVDRVNTKRPPLIREDQGGRFRGLVV
jgi:hypothetical protein